MDCDLHHQGRCAQVSPATWTQPSTPSNFIKTVVICDVCKHKTRTITCSVEQATRTVSTETGSLLHQLGQPPRLRLRLEEE
ncbi:hypothetical protein VM1G_11777 [Cytospora mali]|uniref:Uncharacterized protein n=1 Tax=Cytospora mali TaxID=578113 RepID=A0A194W6C8_CYTMA|nr:hypothetical protein VM1G_11777 [Valsa mali]